MMFAGAVAVIVGFLGVSLSPNAPAVQQPVIDSQPADAEMSAPRGQVHSTTCLLEAASDLQPGSSKDDLVNRSSPQRVLSTVLHNT